MDLKKKILRIVQKVENQDITAYEIAKNTGLSTTGIQNLIDGKIKKPRAETVEKIHNYIYPVKKQGEENILKEHPLAYKLESFEKVLEVFSPGLKEYLIETIHETVRLETRLIREQLEVLRKKTMRDTKIQSNEDQKSTG